MKKSSLGTRVTGYPTRLAAEDVQKSLNRLTLDGRKSGIPRPSGRPPRSSSENREGSNRGFSGLRRSKSQLSFASAFTATPYSVTPQMANRYVGVGNTGSTHSSKNFFTPTGSEACYSGQKSLKSSTCSKVLKDHRNLGDKAFQSRAVQLISGFLYGEAGILDFIPSPLNLRHMMLKTFVTIVDYLAKCLDFGIVINMSNYLEEIPHFMKILKYPGNVNQSWLKTANTQHALPHVLGLLSWLVTLVINYRKFTVQNICELSDPGTGHEMFQYGSPQIYLEHFCKQYFHWNSSNEEQLKKEEDDFIQTLSINAGCGDDAIENLEREIVNAKKMLEDPNEVSEIENIRAEEAKYNAIQNDLAQINAHKTQMEDFLQTLDSKVAEEKLKLKEKEESCAILAGKKMDIIEKLNNQVMSASERDELLKLCQDLSIAIRSNEEIATELLNTTYKDDINFTKIRERMRKKSQQFNKTIFLESHWLPELTALQIPNNLLHPGVREELAALDLEAQQLLDKLRSDLGKYESEHKDKSDELHEVKGRLSKASKEIIELEGNNEKLEELLRTFKNRCAEEANELKSKACELKAEIQTLLNDETLANAIEKVELATKRNESFKERLLQTMKKASEFFKTHTKITNDYKKSILDAKQQLFDNMREVDKARAEKIFRSIDDARKNT